MYRAIAILILMLSVTSSAEARRHRYNNPLPKHVSVFDKDTWQKPVQFPGIVSSYQVYSASKYAWQTDEVWRIPKAEQELKTYHHAANKSLSPVLMISLGTLLGCGVGLLSLIYLMSRPYGDLT